MVKRKNALITGASRGIGRAVAEKFASEGYDLILNCHSSYDELLKFANELKDRYEIEVHTFKGDVGSPDFIKFMIEESYTYFGHIDVLVNNAGISYTGLMTELTVEDWRRIIATNLDSVFYTSHEIVPIMLRSGGGRIINITSIWGEVGASCEVAYSATKGGVNAFTKALAKELALSKIIVNAVSCGFIDTEMNNNLSEEEKAEFISSIPIDRGGTAEEVAEVVYNVSCLPEFVTGQIIRADGGYI